MIGGARVELHKIHSFSRKQLTAELAENAEKVIIDNRCGLSELCGELKCFSYDQTGRSRPAAALPSGSPALVSARASMFQLDLCGLMD